MSREPRVIAFGIDAGDPLVLRSLLASGDLPTLGRLGAAGVTGRVEAGAWIGSGAVWPTFFMARRPECHGFYSAWPWNPQAMDLARADCGVLEPWWRVNPRAGWHAAIIDVPFAPVVGLTHLDEIANWGTHDWLGPAPLVSPPSLASLWNRNTGVPREHPLRRAAAEMPDEKVSASEVGRLIDACVEGVSAKGALVGRLAQSRPADLVLAVFGEAHRACHYLMGSGPDLITSGIRDVLRAIDRAIGEVIAIVHPQHILVFSLHGMRPTRGTVDVLDDLLGSWGEYARGMKPNASLGRSLRAALTAAKSHAPAWLKSRYHRSVPLSVRVRVGAATSRFPGVDWSRTRAFAIPTDQHGWIRLNLRGREAAGIVDPVDYARLCASLRDRLMMLRTTTGIRLVDDVVLLAEHRDGEPPATQPDLVVHWSPEVCEGPHQIVAPRIPLRRIAPQVRGQHAAEGFYIWAAMSAGCPLPSLPGTVGAAELGEIIRDTSI
ncbi:MAG: alkaline phosphatase family protein [Acidobacteria bacterium]|nr:alkaline phosphatase family protein [Acidobacteriota bacterium]